MYAEYPYDCFGNCINDIDDDQVCDELEVLGCTDSSACNFNPDATEEDDSCDFESCLGCTDPIACNYNSNALIEDGTCDYCSCENEGYSLSINAIETGYEDEIGTTYRFYLNTTNDNDVLSAVFGNNLYPLEVHAPEGVYNADLDTAWSALSLQPDLLSVNPMFEFDTYAKSDLGPVSSSGLTNAMNPEIIEDQNQPITPFFQIDGATDLLSNTLFGASYYIPSLPGMPYDNAVPNSDLQILVMQVTTFGSISGTLNFQVFPQGNNADFQIISIDFNGEGTFGDVVDSSLCGCDDELACNFDPNVLYNDGSCLYNDICGVCDGPGDIYECGCYDIPEGECDCNGNTIDALGICGGDCQEDIDQDGICDVDEIFGCTDTSACNYNSNATEEDGSCTYDCYGCNDPLACNYDATASIDDGTCIFPGDPCNDNVEETENDFLQTDCSCNGYGCTDDEACNYIEGALTDNSLCNYVGEFGISGALIGVTDVIFEYSYPYTPGSTYEWTIVDGDITLGETTNVVEVVWWGIEEGQLCVVETNAEGCSGEIACIDVSIINSISEHETLSFEIYPNPTRDILNVKLDGSNPFVIYDMLGREVWTGVIASQGTIDVTNLSAGTYMITTNMHGLQQSARFIVD